MTGSVSRLRFYRFPAFVLATTLLVGVGAAMVWSIHGFTRSAERIEHTYQEMTAAEAVRSATRSVESNARGYRLTGRNSMQAEYLAAVPLAQRSAAELVALTASDPTQQQRAIRLQTMVRQRLDQIRRLVALQNDQGSVRAREASLASQGFDQMQRINALTDEILAQENAVLRARAANATQQVSLLTAFVVAGIALPLVLLGVLMWGLARENRRSQALERDARNTLRDLAVSLEQRSQLSEQRRVLGAYAGLLQSCQNLDEAMSLTAQVIGQLLPHAGGRCYVLRASQNLAESIANFGEETVPSDPVLAPTSCWALRRGQPHRSGSGVGNIYCTHLHVEELPDGGWTLCVPLIAQGTSLGLLSLNGTEGGRDEDVALIEAIGEQLSLAMVNLQLRESLRVQSLRDPLTGLFNRRYLEENLQRELMRCERRGLPLSVLMIDIDHFKRFNDQHGHAAGDALLARIGQTLQAMTRDEDLACRYGGEEFTVVLPEADSEAACRRADEIRITIGSTTILHLRKNLGPTTASIGVATFPTHGQQPDELMEVADAALYRAKSEGRDRVVLATASAVVPG